VTTEQPRGPDHPRAGFTLIEVLIAMVILAVGLLALESLGIGAARMVARAERRSSYVAMATDTLERTLSRLREGLAAGAHTPYVQNHATVNLVVTDLGDVGTSVPPRRRFDVTVRVIPQSPFPASDSVRLVGSVVR